MSTPALSRHGKQLSVASVASKHASIHWVWVAVLHMMFLRWTKRMRHQLLHMPTIQICISRNYQVCFVCRGWAERHAYTVHKLCSSAVQELNLPTEYWLSSASRSPLGAPLSTYVPQNACVSEISYPAHNPRCNPSKKFHLSGLWTSVLLEDRFGYVVNGLLMNKIILSKSFF